MGYYIANEEGWLDWVVGKYPAEEAKALMKAGEPVQED